MNRKLIAFSTLALTMAVAIPVLAQTSSTTGGTTTTTPQTNAGVVIACVGAAVNTREAAIDAAVMTHTQAINAAYTTRAAALKQAYLLTKLSDVWAANKAAWKAFSASIRSAANDWKTARRAAWSAFRTAERACHPAARIRDSGNSGAEVSGQ